ncbi:MAG: zf-HC2 domain-containing protein [Bacteroidota bacterium]
MNDRTIGHPGDMLQGYVDGTLTVAELRSVADHLTACTRCRSELQEFKRVDQILRQIPLERASVHLSGTVLERLHIGMPHDAALRVLARVGAGFAFLIVAATLIAVCAVTGVIDLGGLAPGGEGAGRWVTEPWNALTQAASGLGAVVARHFPFLSQQGALAILTFTAAVAALLGAMDLLFSRRSMRR